MIDLTVAETRQQLIRRHLDQVRAISDEARDSPDSLWTMLDCGTKSCDPVALVETAKAVIWVDGIYVSFRLEHDLLCLLVMIGARPNGRKELIAIEDGYRESTESRLDMLRDLKVRGMQGSVPAINDKGDFL